MPGGDGGLSGLGDIFGMPATQSYVPPAEVSTIIDRWEIKVVDYSSFCLRMF